MHHEYIEKFPDYIEKKLSKEEMKQLQLHLHECGKCNAQYKKFQQTWSILLNPEMVEPPPFLKTRILATIRKNERAGFYPLWENLLVKAMYFFGILTGFFQTEILNSSLETFSANEIKLLSQVLDAEKIIGVFF